MHAIFLEDICLESPLITYRRWSVGWVIMLSCPITLTGSGYRRALEFCSSSLGVRMAQPAAVVTISKLVLKKHLHDQKRRSLLCFVAMLLSWCPAFCIKWCHFDQVLAKRRLVSNLLRAPPPLRQFVTLLSAKCYFLA